MIIKVSNADFSSVSIGKAFNECWVEGEGTALPSLFTARDADSEYSKCEIAQVNNPSQCEYVRKITQTNSSQRGRLVSAPTLDIYNNVPEPVYPPSLGMAIWIREPDNFASFSSKFNLFGFALQCNVSSAALAIQYYTKANLTGGAEVTDTVDSTYMNTTYKMKLLKTAQDSNSRNWYCIGIVIKFNNFKSAYDALSDTNKQLRVQLACGTGFDTGDTSKVNYIGNLQIVTKLKDDNYLDPDTLYE